MSLTLASCLHSRTAWQMAGLDAACTAPGPVAPVVTLKPPRRSSLSRSMRIAATVSRGGRWPDGTCHPGGCNVVICILAYVRARAPNRVAVINPLSDCPAAFSYRLDDRVFGRSRRTSHDRPARVTLLGRGIAARPNSPVCAKPRARHTAALERFREQHGDKRVGCR